MNWQCDDDDGDDDEDGDGLMMMVSSKTGHFGAPLQCHNHAAYFSCTLVFLFPYILPYEFPHLANEKHASQRG